MSPPFSKGWITFLHLFYIVRRILTIGKNLYYIRNAEIPLFSLGVPHCAYLLVFKYLYLLFLCHKSLIFCSKNLQTRLQILYAYFIISSSNSSVSRSMLGSSHCTPLSLYVSYRFIFILLILSLEKFAILL